MAATTTAERRVPAPTTEAAPHSYYLEIFLVSFSALLLEISYTRVISFKLFYYFTYLVIGLALLGVGAGGVLVSISDRVRRARTDAVLLASTLSGAVAVGVGYVIVAEIPTNTLRVWQYNANTVTTGAALLAICVVMFASFVPAGVVISTLFGRAPEGIGRLYFADLLGAGVACALAVPLAASIGPPATIILAAGVLAIASVRVALRLAKPAAWCAFGLALVLGLLTIGHTSLPDVRLDEGKALHDDGTFVYSSWSPLFRIDVRDVGGVRTLFHDGLPGSIMLRWDGNLASLAQFQFSHGFTAFPFALAPRPDHELIIGAAAGHETTASLFFGSRHIDAIEINPVTYWLTTKKLADYDGHIAQQPGVHYVRADGRSFLARSKTRYNLIWYPAPDSYSATNASTASAFVLSESYLYTSDAIKASLDHLAPGGVLVAQFGELNFDAVPNRTARYIATARDALAQAGIHDASSHIMVATMAGQGGFPDLSTIAIKKEPFGPADVHSFVTALRDAPSTRLVYAPGIGGPPNRISQAVAGRAPTLHGSYPYSVGPISDDKPFFWHFKPFSDVASTITSPIHNGSVEVAVGERVLLLLLAIALLLSAVFLLLPFLAIRKRWQAFELKRWSSLYFIAIGFGFMFFEIPLIQRFVLFLGYPTYSLTVTLSSLLLFVGVGAYFSKRVLARPHAIPIIGSALLLLGCFYLFALRASTDALLDLPFAARVAFAFVVLAPLGFSLGMFMPLGLTTIAQHSPYPQEYVAWGWALNGFASVVGSVLATMIAMTYGFQTVLILALVLYAVALGCARVLSTRAPSAT